MAFAYYLFRPVNILLQALQTLIKRLSGFSAPLQSAQTFCKCLAVGKQALLKFRGWRKDDLFSHDGRNCNL